MKFYHKRFEEYRHGSIKGTEKLTGSIATWTGSWNFLMLHVIWFSLWLALRLDINLLTLIVSLEAIILMNILLMAQNRQAKKDDLRDEADYQADKNAEEGIGQIKKTLEKIEKKIK